MRTIRNPGMIRSWIAVHETAQATRILVLSLLPLWLLDDIRLSQISFINLNYAISPAMLFTIPLGLAISVASMGPKKLGSETRSLVLPRLVWLGVAYITILALSLATSRGIRPSLMSPSALIRNITCFAALGIAMNLMAKSNYQWLPGTFLFIFSLRFSANHGGILLFGNTSFPFSSQLEVAASASLFIVIWLLYGCSSNNPSFAKRE